MCQDIPTNYENQHSRCVLRQSLIVPLGKGSINPRLLRQSLIRRFRRHRHMSKEN